MAISTLFYAQFSYFKNRIVVIEDELANIIGEIESYSQQSSLEESIKNMNIINEGEADDSYMILNLTYPLEVNALKDELRAEQVNENELTKKRSKRNIVTARKPSRKFTANLTNHYNQSGHKLHDILFIRKSENGSHHMPNPNEHFFIQAYSKISVNIPN